MAHNVICSYCKERFDRDRSPYVITSKTGNGRYGHASCYLRKKEIDPDTPELKIIDPSNFVTCIYCKKTFDKSKSPFKLFSNGKYAHKECFDIEEKRERTDQEKLERYIMKLFNTDYVYGRIQKQIKDYVTNYGYTYSGIQKALIYYYEVTKHPFSMTKSQGGIGIVPYVYSKAFDYYYSIWEAQQKQENIVNTDSLNDFIPKVIEVHIQNPQRKERKRKLFTFLDDKEDK